MDAAGGKAARSIALVVEDDGNLRALVAKQLDRMGFAVHQVEDGEAALAWLSACAPSGLPALICLDLSLPAMSGFRVCEEIRSAPRTRTVPILVITARTSVQDQTFALEMGADGFLAKPFKMQDFESRVNALLRVPA